MLKRNALYLVSFLALSTAALAAEKTAATALIWRPVLFYGLILGLYELFLIHGDENFRGSHWFGHGLQAVGFMFIAIFFVLNVKYAMDVTGYSKLNIAPWLKSPLTFQILIGVILNFKIHAVSAVIHTQGVAARGLAEHWSHTILVSALVVAVHYVHKFIAPLLPVFFR